jgi:hypothetical protein
MEGVYNMNTRMKSVVYSEFYRDGIMVQSMWVRKDDVKFMWIRKDWTNEVEQVRVTSITPLNLEVVSQCLGTKNSQKLI